MQDTHEFLKVEINPDKFVYSSGKGTEQFNATLILNTNDASVFVHITQLPETEDQQIIVLRSFKDILY